VRDVEVVRSWPTYRAVDFGYRHPACLWAQIAPSGQVFSVDELLPEAMTTQELAHDIAEREAAWSLNEPPRLTYCDPAGKAANVQTAESEFEIFRRSGLKPKGKPSGVRDGCVRIMNALADPDIQIVVAERCTGLVRALSQVKPHRTRPECYDFDHEVFSHPLDALRYLLVNLRPGAPAGDGGGIGTNMTGTRRTGF
jgi:hypothetical protein